MSLKSLRFGAACVALALVGAVSQQAHAYGIEGLFGGRPSPDAYIPTTTAVQTEVRPDRAQTVLEHPRADYDAIPVTLGSFDLYPSFEAGLTSDSNIYAQRGNRTSDFVYSAHPALTIQSDWSRHALAFKTSGDVNFYHNNSQEDYSNFVNELEGRYDIMNRTWVMGRTGYQYITEPRTTPNDTSGAKPTTFNVYSAGASAYRGLGMLQTQLDYDFRRLDYNNPPTSTGFTVNESSRDRDEHVVGGRVTYSITDDFNPYVKAAYNVRDYDNSSARTSNGYRADAGVVWDFGGITSLDGYVGYLAQNYGNFNAHDTNGGVDFGGRLTWNATTLTTVVLETSRSVEETTLTNYNSFMSTGGSGTVTHELLRNLLIEADTAYSRNDFAGAGSRHDDVMALGTGMRYLFNRNLYSDLGYNWSHRVSTDLGQDYVKHVVTLRLGAQY